VPQAQEAQQRLKNASAPPSYGKVSSSSKEHFHEGYLDSFSSVLELISRLFFSCRFRHGLGAQNGLGPTPKKRRPPPRRRRRSIFPASRTMSTKKRRTPPTTRRRRRRTAGHVTILLL
jgi:hypothetical protein